MCFRGKIVVWEGRKFYNLLVRMCKRLFRVVGYLLVIWLIRIREVIMRLYCEKSCFNFFWVIVFGSSLTYKFVFLIEVEFGRV